MKYKNLKKSEIKELFIKDLSGGIRSEERADEKKPFLSESKNMLFKNNMLKTRPGFNIKYTMQNVGRDLICGELKSAETEFSYNDRNYSVAFRIDSDFISYYEIRTFLIESDFTVKEPASIHLNRIDSENFPCVANIIYFSGKPAKGCGLFALLRTYNRNKDVFTNFIYELSSDLTTFKFADYSSAVYIPVVYKNGRGNKFSTISDEAIKNRAEPEKPETLNLLTPQFKAYYSSDSYSNKFKLPFVNLDDSIVSCRVYASPDVYADFKIKQGKTESDEVSIFSYTAKMHIDRENGIFYFTVNNNSNLFSVPAAENFAENNIEITAGKTLEGGEDKIFSSKGCVDFNSRLYFYGNSVAPNEVLCAKTKDKIYFPSTATVSVGRTGDAVTALGTVCNKLIAFKKSEIFRIKTTSGKIFTTEGDIVGNIANYYSSDQLECEAVHNEIGCDCPLTLKQCSNRLIWLNSDKKVYTLATTTYGKENNIFEISYYVDNLLADLNSSDFENSSAVSSNGYYNLLIKSKIFTLNYKNKDFGYPEKYSKSENSSGGVSWYYSEFAGNDYKINCMKLLGKPVFCFTGEKSTISYIATLDNNVDSYENMENSDFVIKNSDISCGLKTGFITFGNEFSKKSLKSIKMKLSSKNDVYLTVISDRFEKKIRIPAFEIEREISINPILPHFKKVRFKIESDNIFSVGSILLKYIES